MKARKTTAVVVLAIVTALAAWALTRPNAPNTILLSNATAASLKGSDNVVAVFVDIANTGSADRLLSVSSPNAASAHFTGQDSRRAVPGSTKVSLSADGMHVVLHGLTGDISDGRTLPLSLTFEKAGTVSTRARVVAPRSKGVASQYGLFGIGDICKVGEGEPAPHIEVIAKQMDDTWRIQVLSQDFEFTPSLVDGPHVPGTGHGHIYLNGLKLGRIYSPTTVIGELPPGAHDIRVTLSTNDHRAYVVGDLPITSAIRIIAD
ncbi:copper chaperone PCu(A)C [Shimia sp.]|uniref:copper chaperone PCu(A)C n=1 Tax=Shimia sp. TaxID=1954381 RepID=UPI003B8B84C6